MSYVSYRHRMSYYHRCTNCYYYMSYVSYCCFHYCMSCASCQTSYSTTSYGSPKKKRTKSYV